MDMNYLLRMVTRWGFEPQTLWLKVKCSTYWASGSRMAALDGLEPSECQSQSLMPYHLATRQSKWWEDMDLNHGTRRNRFTVCRVWPLRYPSKKKMVPKTGIEPVTYWLQVSCSTNWAISAKNKWWAIQDSNLWPPACKADALTNWANRPKPYQYRTPLNVGIRLTDI